MLAAAEAGADFHARGRAEPSETGFAQEAVVKTLVSGHRGYIGSVLAPLLAEAGHDVVGLDTGYYEGCDFGGEPARLRSLRADVRDITPADLAGFEAVVHLAALSNDPLGDLSPEWTYAINSDEAEALSMTR